METQISLGITSTIRKHGLKRAASSICRRTSLSPVH